MHQYHFSTADTDSKYKTSLSNLFVFDKIEEDESFFNVWKKKQKPDLTLKEIISTMIKIIIFPRPLISALNLIRIGYRCIPTGFIFAKHDRHTIFSLFFVKQNS